jgi:hypothetical protein
LVGADQRHPGEDDDQDDEERRQKAPRAAEPELLQPDPSAADLVEEDVGDQVAAEGEEDADAQQPAFGPLEAKVA